MCGLEPLHEIKLIYFMTITNFFSSTTFLSQHSQMICQSFTSFRFNSNLDIPFRFIIYLYQRIQMNIPKNGSSFSHHDASLKEALAIMKGIGSNKKDTGISIHSLSKEIYQYTIAYAQNNTNNASELDQIEDFMETPEATKQILFATKQNLRMILSATSTNTLKTREEKEKTATEQSQQELKQIIKERDNKIRSLEMLMMESQKNFKQLQLKLLNNIKKMKQQLQERQLQINELQEIMAEKDEQLESLTKINDKKYKRIRELQEDVYDLQLEVEAKDEELLAERNCSTILQKQLNKIVDKSILSIHQKDEQNHSNSCSHEFNLALQMAKKQTSEIAIQTEKNDEEQSNTKQEDHSEYCESRDSKYLESIERLTCELSEAYERINELTKPENTKNLTQRKTITKTKTSSTHFSKKR